MYEIISGKEPFKGLSVTDLIRLKTSTDTADTLVLEAGDDRVCAAFIEVWLSECIVLMLFSACIGFHNCKDVCTAAVHFPGEPVVTNVSRCRSSISVWQASRLTDPHARTSLSSCVPSPPTAASRLRNLVHTTRPSGSAQILVARPGRNCSPWVSRRRPWRASHPAIRAPLAPLMQTVLPRYGPVRVRVHMWPSSMQHTRSGVACHGVQVAPPHRTTR